MDPFLQPSELWPLLALDILAALWKGCEPKNNVMQLFAVRSCGPGLPAHCCTTRFISNRHYCLCSSISGSILAARKLARCANGMFSNPRHNDAHCGM
jgi:hypothetical protein